MTTQKPVTLAFVDTETTHLSAVLGEVWEAAVVLRDPDGGEVEYVWQFLPQRLDGTHAEALRIGRFEERFAVPYPHDAAFTGYPTGPVPMTREAAVAAVTNVLKGTILVGNNAAFDDRFLRTLLGIRDEQPWHYRPICIANLAEGYLWATQPDLMAQSVMPRSSRWLSRHVGVEPPAADVAHTALGDARWARAVYDAVTAGGA